MTVVVELVLFNGERWRPVDQEPWLAEYPDGRWPPPMTSTFAFKATKIPSYPSSLEYWIRPDAVMSWLYMGGEDQ